MISFSDYRFGFDRHPLSRPFHFKGGSFNEKWINVVRLLLDGEGGRAVTGIGGNAVLWSDERVFSDWSESGGNQLMSVLAERAVQISRGTGFSDPIEAHRAIRDELHDYAKKISGRSDITPTFTLNAMVALDFAMWKAFALTEGTERLLDLVPNDLQGTLRAPGGDWPVRVVRVPLISYNVPVSEVLSLVAQGHRVLKIKIGQSGTAEEMLRKDADRLAALHNAIGRDSQGVRYYLDANGRYPDLETLKRLLDTADRIGMLSRIIILEEPFAYENRVSVAGLPVPIAADESLHAVEDLQERLDLGYGAVALKPAGKTLSLSLLMARASADLGVPCFVADSAGVPALLAWNLAVAAHLPVFPGVGEAILESNGAQNYPEWNQLLAEYPEVGADFLTPNDGAFELREEFFSTSGGIFRHVGHYERLLHQPDSG